MNALWVPVCFLERAGKQVDAEQRGYGPMELAGYASPGASATPDREGKEGLAVREQTNGEGVKPQQERP